MKLYKALKIKKNLVGEIAKLKEQITTKNSYLEGSKNGEKFDVASIYEQLLSKIDQLTGLKYAISVANREIQGQIFLLGEYKALITFWNNVSVVEGSQTIGYDSKITNYIAQIDEKKRNELVASFQKRVDVIQEELDEYNFTTEIPWGDMTEEELIVLDDKINK
jgi:hypothetical protein